MVHPAPHDHHEHYKMCTFSLLPLKTEKSMEKEVANQGI